MTMQLHGLRDSLHVKLVAALKAIEHTEYKTPDNEAHTTLAVCANTTDTINDIPMVSVQIEKMNADNTAVIVYDVKIRFDGQVYTIKDTVRNKDKTTDLYFVSELNAGGKIVVDYVVAKVCYFIGTPYK